MAGKFEVYKDKSGEHRFRLKAGNGEITGNRQQPVLQHRFRP
jgi:uncharacterized protein YegP (UPF0339 family)